MRRPPSSAASRRKARSGSRRRSRSAVTLAWLAAKYDQYAAVGVGGVSVDVAGHRLSNAPEWTGRLWLEWARAVGDGARLSLRADARGQSTVYFTPFNDAVQRQVPYGLLDVSAELRARSGRWAFGGLRAQPDQRGLHHRHVQFAAAGHRRTAGRFPAGRPAVHAEPVTPVKLLIDVSVIVLSVLMMTALGLDLTGRDFARVRRHPGLVLGGLVGALLLLPPIAVLLIWLLRPVPDAAAAVLLIAACPIGGIANTFSYLARASGALSITLTGLSCLLAAVTMPMLGRLFAGLLPDSLSLTVPVSTLLVQFAALLIVPAALGMWVRRRWPEWAIARQPLLRQLSFAGVALVLVLIVLDDPGAFVGGLWTTVPLAAAFVVCLDGGGLG